MADELLFLDRETVLACAARIDVCAVVETVLRRHAEGRTLLPPEGYLPWRNSEGAYCRSLALLGAVDVDGGMDGDSEIDGEAAADRQRTVYGVKLINAATSNPAHGRERAAGIGLLFDPETARPTVLAEAGWLSAARTAAYTMVSLRHLGPSTWDALSVIGCGTLARAHLDLLVRAFPSVGEIHAYDRDVARAHALAQWAAQHCGGMRVYVHEDAEKAVRAAPVVVTTTTSDDPYIPAHWLAPGTFVAHVSLDDLLPEVFDTAEAVYVDDVALVIDNPRRVLGRLMRDDAVLPPQAESRAGDDTHGGRRLNGTLGQVLTGAVPAVRPSSGHVVSNPFGMAVLDVGLLGAIQRIAVLDGLGRRLELS